MAIVSVFNTEEKFVQALENAKKKNMEIVEVFTPYPIHEVLHLLKQKSKMTIAAWFYGLFAGLGVLSFLYYTSVISWPLNYGGKPFNSFPSFIVITLILIILSVTILSLFTFSLRAKLFPGNKAEIIDKRATDDKFIILINGEEASVNQEMKAFGAEEIYKEPVKP